MRSLDQVRAANAFKHSDKTIKGANDGDIVKKIPSYVRTNGFLATLAFAMEKKGGYIAIFNDIADHLSHEDIKLIQSSSAVDLLSKLSNCNSAKLRAVTEESMEYLNYYRRFAGKGGKD